MREIRVILDKIMISKVTTSYLFLVIFLVHYARTKFTDVPRKFEEIFCLSSKEKHWVLFFLPSTTTTARSFSFQRRIKEISAKSTQQNPRWIFQMCEFASSRFMNIISFLVDGVFVVKLIVNHFQVHHHHHHHHHPKMISFNSLTSIMINRYLQKNFFDDSNLMISIDFSTLICTLIQTCHENLLLL